jgi:pimeloyl-ACP methyl ester carboxylesterase
MIKEYKGGMLRTKLKRYHGSNVDCAFRGWSETWVHPDFRTWTVESLLAGIEVPVFVIQGKADGYGSLRQVGSILENVSGPVQARVIPGCGHVPYREMPEIMVKAIAQFLQDL